MQALSQHPSFGGVKIGLDGYKLCRGVTGPVPKYFLNNSFTWAHIYESKLSYIEPQGPSRPVNNGYHVDVTSWTL